MIHQLPLRLPRRRLLVGTGWGIPFASLAGVFLSCYLTWRPISDVMFTLSDALFLIGLAQLAYRRRLPLEPFRFLTPVWMGGLMMLILGLLIGSVNAPDPTRWPIVASQYVFAWFVLPMILLGHGEANTIRMLKAFVWGVFAMNLFGAIIYFTYSGTFLEARALLGLDFLSGGRRLGAFASDANWNGAVLAMAVPAALYLRAKNAVSLVQILAWLAVLLLGVMLSASFTAFMCCVFALVVFAATSPLRIAPKQFAIGMGIAIVAALALMSVNDGLFLPKTFMARVGNAVGNGDISEAGTFEGRMELMEEAWAMVNRHTFVGLGADQFRVVSEQKAPVHNMYMLLWVEGGVISLFGWITMQLVPFIAAARAYRRDRTAAALTLSTAVTFVIASTASPHMYARLWSTPILLALAASLNVAANVRLDRRRSRFDRLDGASIAA